MSAGNHEARPIAEIWKLLKRVTGELWELTELQGQLLKLDLASSTKRSILPMVTLAIGLLAVLTGLPLILWGAVHGLTELLNWPLWQSLLAVGALIFALGLGLLIFAIGRLQRCCQPMERSLTELKRNAHWIKNTLSDFET